MTNEQIFHFSGLALMAGAVTFLIHLVARSVISVSADPATMALQPLWVPVNLVGVLGAILVLFGLPGLYAWMAGTGRFSTLVLVGMVLLALAWLFSALFLSLYSVLVAPWLANQAPDLAAAPLPTAILIAFIVATLAEMIGTVLLAIPFVRGLMAPRWVGYALPAAALLRVVGNFLAPSGPAANLAINLLSNTGPMLLVIGLGALGLRMWTKHAP